MPAILSLLTPVVSELSIFVLAVLLCHSLSVASDAFAVGAAVVEDVVELLFAVHPTMLMQSRIHKRITVIRFIGYFLSAALVYFRLQLNYSAFCPYSQ